MCLDVLLMWTQVLAKSEKGCDIFFSYTLFRDHFPDIYVCPWAGSYNGVVLFEIQDRLIRVKPKY